MIDRNPFADDFDGAEEVGVQSQEEERLVGEAAPAPTGSSHIRFHHDLDQGSLEWLQARCGLLTASEMKLILTPTLKMASNDKERTHLYELLAQRITSYVEPHYISDDMLRGHEEEIEARKLYNKLYAPVHEVGFITNDRFGFTIGYSPDGLVGEHGLIECKSRRQKYQVQTIIENVGADLDETVPAEFVLQIQTGLLVSERQWLDFVSYSGGLPMAVVRVYPDHAVQDAIVQAAEAFEHCLAEKLEIYRAACAAKGGRLTPTERRVVEEMMI